MNDRNRKAKLNKKSMVMIGAAFLIILAVAALMYYMDHRSTCLLYTSPSPRDS